MRVRAIHGAVRCRLRRIAQDSVDGRAGHAGAAQGGYGAGQQRRGGAGCVYSQADGAVCVL